MIRKVKLGSDVLGACWAHALTTETEEVGFPIICLVLRTAGVSKSYKFFFLKIQSRLTQRDYYENVETMLIFHDSIACLSINY